MSTTTAYLLYAIFVVGAVGLYCLMPRRDGSRTVVGVVVGASSVISLLMLLAIDVIDPEGHPLYFCLFSGIALLGAARVITHTNPVYSAIYFVMVAVAVAALLVLLDAEFSAIALIIVYAGAILVTYLFMIMLAQQAESPLYDRTAREPVLAIIAGFLIMAAIAGRAGDGALVSAGASSVVRQAMWQGDAGGDALVEEPPRKPKHEAPGANASGAFESNTKAIGVALATKYVMVLEVAGLLLLIAMVGAIAFSTKWVPTVDPPAPQRPLGEVGREVEPF